VRRGLPDHISCYHLVPPLHRGEEQAHPLTSQRKLTITDFSTKAGGAAHDTAIAVSQACVRPQRRVAEPEPEQEEPEDYG
jgi:hypothetical protein